MREFNTSGPCNPALHYTVMREALIAEGKEKVRKGRYFTLFAPRQTGKTTYFQLLYVAESGQKFEDKVINAIYDNTKGQPGLVCAIAAHLLQKVSNRTIIMADFLAALDYFLKLKYDKNILNIIRKAKEKKAFMCRLLFGEQPIDFNVYVENITYLHANGVIDNINGYVSIPVPLYSKCIITAFRPLSNGMGAG
ncbi:MAG: hypothetical protein GY862_33490 [Gammaproteobacteria bacterium]|nr:hypothetical protein [Gammaproteobacteria bacterium]